MSLKHESARIILADDHPIILEGIKKLLEENGYRVIAMCKNGNELVEKTSLLKPDLVITDLAMPGMNGVEAIQNIRKKQQDSQIIVLSMHKDPELFKKCLSSGIRGYILKEDIYEQMLHSIKAVLRGETSYSPKLLTFFAEDSIDAKENELAKEILTKRELEVMKYLAQGHSNREIATRLDLSIRTIETHRGNIMKKMDFENVQEMVAFCVKNKLDSD